VPAVAKTSDEAIVTAAKRIVETAGIEALSMQAVAEAVDVRPPSLYKRFTDREALVRSVQHRAFGDLRSVLERVPRDRPAAERLERMAHAYRAFARRHKRLYAAMFAGTMAFEGEDLSVRAAATAPLLECIRSLVRNDDVLPVARLFTAFAHGFVSMELAGAFRLGGDIDEAFSYGVNRLIASITSPVREP
jgi:AcrR family transcriptional regulator